MKRSYGKGVGVGEGTDYSVSNHDCPSSTLCKFGNWRGEGMETKAKEGIIPLRCLIVFAKALWVVLKGISYRGRSSL